MRHGKAGRHLSRSSGHRRALYRNLITELFRHERIETTEAKARAVRPLAERLVTKARKARAERVVELAKQRNSQKLTAWFNVRRADQLIALADKGDDETLGRMAAEMALHARRQLLAELTDDDVAHKLVEEIAPRFEDRPGGYTRMFKLGARLGEFCFFQVKGSQCKDCHGQVEELIFKPAQKTHGLWVPVEHLQRRSHDHCVHPLEAAYIAQGLQFHCKALSP